jgi:hypothetical protein
MGEPATDGETRDSQDRPVVNPAGAGRKIECLSREICHSANYEAMCAVTQQREWQKSAEAIVSRWLSGEGLNSEIKVLPRRSRLYWD